MPLKQFGLMRLSLADPQCVAQALPSPPLPTPALELAFAQCRDS